MRKELRLFAWVWLFSLSILSACGKSSDSSAEGQNDGSASENGGEVEYDPENPYGALPQASEYEGERNFAELINKYSRGRPRKIPWVGFWWPYTANGIASGRYSGGASPAGKYDAARGNRTRAQSWEVLNHGARVPKVQSWWGHCNGWCAASALFDEPSSTRRVNGISFSISDQKALLSEAAMEVSADFFGNRVDWSSDYQSFKYDDVIPAQYFLVLTQYMGRLGQVVLIDRYTGDQVWNQPAVGYRFDYPKPEDYLGADPSAPSVYRIKMRSVLWWGRDDVDPGALTLPFEFETNAHFDGRVLQFELWLDGPVVFDPNGKIISSGNVLIAREGNRLVGGQWKNGEGYLSDAHPDYMWIPFSVLKPNETEPYANPHVDVDWLKKFMIPGVDDPGTPAGPIAPAPTPDPSPSASPGPSPSPRPSASPSGSPPPVPTPTPTPTASPSPGPSPIPSARPTLTPSPRP
jgi:hypothetical protein